MIDLFGRNWHLDEDELCSDCGQPDNCGDCDHTRLSEDEVFELGGEI